MQNRKATYVSVHCIFKSDIASMNVPRVYSIKKGLTGLSKVSH